MAGKAAPEPAVSVRRLLRERRAELKLRLVAGRSGLARAILKRAPLLVLDEPTANLDPASERAMLDVIRQAARGRTTLIATHSPAVATLADRVVTL